MPLLKRQRELLLVIAVFAAIVVIVNPFRELLTQDDGWAYARTVKHLLETGEYHLDSWAAANMPAQVYLAAFMARIFGYSLSLLRISTLLLYLGGAIAFYQLLYESGSSGILSAAMTLALICSPLVQWLGFTFMTDVQFLGWVLITCWLYSRGLRQGSIAMMFLGGLAAALAIGTRQFGVALPGGLVLAKMFAGWKNRAPGSAILAGVTLPCATFIWQLWAAKEHPTFTQSVRLVEQRLYLGQGAVSFLLQSLWRGAVLLEYLGLYLAVLIPGLLLLIYQRRTRSHSYSGLAGCVAGAYLVLGHIFNAMEGQGALLDRLRAALIPAIPWVIGFVTPNRIRYQLVLTVAGLFSAVLLCGLLFQGSAPKEAWLERDMASTYLLGTTVAFGILHFAYVQFNDTYLIVFIPFVLIAIAHLLRAQNASAQCIKAIALCSAILGISVAAWMRADYNKQEAVWQACDQVHETGVNAIQIRGSLHWVEYHSAFDDWLAQLGSAARPEDYSGPYRLHDPFYAWVEQQQKDAEYIVFPAEQPPLVEGYDIAGRMPYSDRRLQERFVYILKRKAA